MPCDIVTVTVTTQAPNIQITNFNVSTPDDNLVRMTYYVSNTGNTSGTVTIERTAVGPGVDMSDTDTVSLDAGAQSYKQFEYEFSFTQNTDVEFCADIV